MFQSIRNFIYQAILAILFFVAFALSLVSLVSYNKNDPGFGKFEKTDQINNYLGIYGANLSSFLNDFIGFGAYLIPLFLFAQSVKIIKHDKIWYLILRFVFLIIGLVFIAWTIQIYAETQEIITNVSLIGIGSVVLGTILLITAVILFSIVTVVNSKK